VLNPTPTSQDDRLAQKAERADQGAPRSSVTVRMDHELQLDWR
jgi:hypothetical protein